MAARVALMDFQSKSDWADGDAGVEIGERTDRYRDVEATDTREAELGEIDFGVCDGGRGGYLREQSA